MIAPDRSREVEAFFNANLIPVAKTPEDTGRRENLFRIVTHLNSFDGGKWGVLVKEDQGGKIPGDIIVWNDTMEHFDVLTGDGGPAWQPRGIVPNPRWTWRGLGGSSPAPDLPNVTLEKRIEALETQLKDLLTKLAGWVDAGDRQMDALEERIKAVEERKFPPSNGFVEFSAFWKTFKVPVRVFPEQ